jgi:hypothetical protein
MKDVDSWKPAPCCGINRRVHGYELSTNISLHTATLISGRSDKNSQSVINSVEAGPNTSTVDMRVVGGDKKGSLKSETNESHGTRTRE